MTYIPISASPQHGPSRLDPFFARSAAPERHSDSEIGLSIRNKFKHIAKYTKFFCVKFLFQYFTRVARKGHTRAFFKHHCSSEEFARPAVQYISPTRNRSARQPDVPQRPQCNTAREVLSGAYPPLFPHLKSVRQGFDMKPYRQTTPTHHGRRHASQPRPQDIYTYGTRPRTCHTLPATSGITARTGMPYHNKKGDISFGGNIPLWRCKRYKPSSVTLYRGLYHLSTTAVTCGLQQPTPRHRTSNP